MNSSSTPVAIPHVEIYTDGGCEPNPGPGGYGVVVLHPKKRAEASGGFRLTTVFLRQACGRMKKSDKAAAAGVCGFSKR